MSTPVKENTQLPSVSVVIAAYADERWQQLCDAVESVRAQTVPVLETVVVVDHNPALLARAQREFTDCTVMANTSSRGASGARNTGAASCHGEIIAFLDDDARSTAHWLAALLRHFAREDIVGVGGRIDPLWAAPRPRWFPMEFGWAVGFSYRGMPETTQPVRNVWTSNMAIRRSVFEAIGGFRDDFGKVGDVARPEDTDLCLRAAAGGGTWLYEPAGNVGHWIPRQRTTFRYFARRCFHEGQGKAALTALDGAGESTAAERSYTRRILPRAVLVGLRDTVSGDAWGAARAAAITAGFAITVAGFAAGWTLLLRDAHERPAQAAGQPGTQATGQPGTQGAGQSDTQATGPEAGTQPSGVAPASDSRDGFAPVLVREVELSQPLATISAAGAPGGRRYGAARVLARWYSEPLALVDVSLADGDVSADRLAAALWPAVAAPLAQRLAAAGEPVPASLPVTGITAAALTPFLRGRAEALADAPPASVIVCTRYRPDRLAGCLDALKAQAYPDYEIIVVDNAPATDAVARLTAAHGGRIPVRYVMEPRPGLSWARNAGLAAARGKIVAFLDDDELPDRHWLAELARGFTVAPNVAGVSGAVLPARLDTQAQCLFERFGGHSKGRGFTAGVFDPASHASQHPLYPLPAFGVGASMAFDRDALCSIGGFDVALGAGTPARAGEDTAAISELMLADATFVYWPSAIMWHDHRSESAELERQLNGYGSGLTAFYTGAVLRDPRRLASLLRLAPRALRDLRGHDSVRTATMGAGYPAALRRANRRGMLAGPVRYLRSRHVQARASGAVR